MEKSFVPWKQIIQFHKEIAIRSEESFFSFELDDYGSERFSYIANDAISKMQVNSRVKANCFSNQLIFSNTDKKNTEYYIGGILWFVNRKVNNEWKRIAYPLLYAARFCERVVLFRIQTFSLSAIIRQIE